MALNSQTARAKEKHQLSNGEPSQSQALGPEVIKRIHLSMKFQLLLKIKIPTNKKMTCVKSLRCCIYQANRYLNAKNCWHFNIYKQDKFRAQQS